MSLFSNSPDRLWSPPSLLSNRYRSNITDVKPPERDADHAPPPSIEINKEWSYTSAPPTCLHDAHRGTFTFTFTCMTLKMKSYYCRNTVKRSIFLMPSHRPSPLPDVTKKYLNITSISFALPYDTTEHWPSVLNCRSALQQLQCAAQIGKQLYGVLCRVCLSSRHTMATFEIRKLQLRQSVKNNILTYHFVWIKNYIQIYINLNPHIHANKYKPSYIHTHTHTYTHIHTYIHTYIHSHM
jgi:hypothetical protein